VPSLRFFHDPQLERGIEMSRLIDQANAPSVSIPLPEDPDVQS
jgi:ribosome-binding factor A